MVNISKNDDSAIKFTFTNNDRYLYNGEIVVPLNSLLLEFDSSDLVIFKKLDGDVFVTFLIANSNFASKDALLAFYEENMVGGNGLPTEEIQEMIDESVSGYADSVLYNSASKYVEFYHNGTGGTKVYEFDASDFVIDGMVDDVRIETISGVSYLVIDFNTASGKEDILIPLTDIFDPSNYYTKTEVDNAISGKADTSAVTESINAAVSGKVDTSTFDTYSGSVETALSGKQDTLIAGSGITISGNVISAEGGGSINVVQTTGTSTADVMSQDAVTTALNDKARKGAAVGGYQFGSYSGVGYLKYINLNGFDIGNSIYYPKINGKDILTSNSIWAENNYNFSLVETSAVTSSVTSASTDSEIPTAKAVYDVLSGKADTSYVDQSVSGKQDTLSAGTNITISGNVISAQGGGGKAVTGGTNISVTTGETADTINCTLPITANTSSRRDDIFIGNDIPHDSLDYGRIIIGSGNKMRYNSSRTGSSILIATPHSNSSIYNNVKASSCIGIGGEGLEVGYDDIFGYGSIAIGFGAKSNINESLAIGYYTVASGTTKTNINNQLKIDSSNQVYIYNKDNTEMICLQDQLGGGSVSSAVTSGDTNAVSSDAVYTAMGGLKLQQITQADYDALVSGGTVDASTLYIITNVVN